MNTNTATQQDPATPPPAAATSNTPPTAEAAPRRHYKNPHRSQRNEDRQGLKSLPFRRKNFTPEEAARMATQRRAVAFLLREKREWTRRARAGGFTDPETGKEHSRADCLALSRRAKEQAALLGRQMADLGRAVNARAIAQARAIGDAQAVASAVFFAPSSRHRRAGDGAALPVIKPRP